MTWNPVQALDTTTASRSEQSSAVQAPSFVSGNLFTTSTGPTHGPAENFPGLKAILARARAVRASAARIAKTFLAIFQLLFMLLPPMYFDRFTPTGVCL